MGQVYSGGCQCGKVRYEVELELGEVIACNCSRCGRLGSLLAFAPASQFRLLSGEGDLATYEFNRHVIKHRFCTTCGIHPFYVPRSDPDKIDVNVRCLDGVDPAVLKPHRFDGHNWEHAIAEEVPWRS